MTGRSQRKRDERGSEDRRDELLLRLLKTPPQPRPKRERGKAGAESVPHFLVIGDKLRVAGNLRRNDDGSITADVYRNLDDYRAGRAMELAVNFEA